MNYRSLFVLIAALALVPGCDRLLGLDNYQTVGSVPAAAAGSTGSCTKHSDCSGATDYCSHTTHRCVSLKSSDCSTVTGAAYDDNAVLIGSLFATTGDQAAANIARERSALLVIGEIEAIGGLPAAVEPGPRRPLAMLSCDASEDPIRAAEHLVKDLEVPAIVGPNNSQNTLDVAMNVTISGGTVTLSPQAVAGSIAELIDNDLTWQMVPSDAQRGPLLVKELESMQRDLRKARRRDLKLSIIVRDDALGHGTRASLKGLTWNGDALADATNLGTHAKIETYEEGRSQADLVAAHAAFAPDVVVLVGSGDAINDIMAPLEASWGSGPRPEYVLIDSSKVPDLLALVDRRPDLAPRVRGTGTTPSPDSLPINQDFLLSYTTRFPDFDEATSAGVGPSYDATYAIAYGIVAAGSDVSGRGIARALRRLGSGQPVQLGPTHILAALRALTSGESITAIGTYSALVWDDRGAISAGSVEIWCVRQFAGSAGFASSGLTVNIPSQLPYGANEVCPAAGHDVAMPPAAASDAGAPDAGRPPAAMSGDAGAQDAGQDAAMPDAGAALEPPRSVPCGIIQCDRTRSQYCCITALRPDAMLVSDFVCEVEPRGCAFTLRCASDRECGNGAICCSDGRSESYCSAAGGCGDGERHLGCDRPSDCRGDQVCCAHGNIDGVFSTECATSCEGEDLMVCDGQNECSSGQRCERSRSMPVIGSCR
jgi:ABC-type branched-subunit amino acid transport system substrate-binding protein